MSHCIVWQNLFAATTELGGHPNRFWWLSKFLVAAAKVETGLTAAKFALAATKTCSGLHLTKVAMALLISTKLFPCSYNLVPCGNAGA